MTSFAGYSVRGASLLFAALAALVPATPALAQADTTAHVTFGAFVDGYYAYGFNRPAGHDPVFTTQAVRGLFGADAAIFAGRDGAKTSNAAAVTSIALRF